MTVDTLFKSNENSWGETNLGTREASFDPSKDLKGPLPLAVAVTKEMKPSSDKGPAVKARMVVTGTSNFPINAYFPTQGNGNLFLNIVSWLAQDEDLISIRPKPADDRRILLSQSQLATLRLVHDFCYSRNCACRRSRRRDGIAGGDSMRFKGTLVLLIVVLALGGFIYFYEIKGGEQREKAKESESQIWKFEDKDIQQIDLASSGQHISGRAQERQRNGS